MDSYIKAAFEELFREDGLTVMAKGLGIKQLLVKFLHYYSVKQREEKKLVFCINATGMEDFIRHALYSDGLMPYQTPKVYIVFIFSGLMVTLY
jgi:hypothetical protein